MAKVQITGLACLILLLGCERSPSEGETRDPRRFGDPYEIIMNESPALPDEPPALIGDTLLAQIAYTGGCADHEFELRSEVRRDTARLWLHHDAQGDTCEEMVFDRFESRVPDRVLEAPAIVLLDPNHDTPFIMRWAPIDVGQQQPPSPSDDPDTSSVVEPGSAL